MEEGVKIDGYHVEKSKLEIYHAYTGNVSAELEVHGILSIVLIVKDHTHSQAIKLSPREILVMHKVFSDYIKDSKLIDEVKE